MFCQNNKPSQKILRMGLGYVDKLKNIAASMIKFHFAAEQTIYVIARFAEPIP